MSGNVKRKQSQQRWSVNKNGFVCAYALMILQIAMVFLLFFTQVCASFATVHKKQQARFMDVAIIHSIKKHLQEEQETVENENDIEDCEQDCDKQSNLKNWSLYYAGINVDFIREKERIFVNYFLDDEKEILVVLDDSEKCITSYEYQNR